MKIRRYLLCVCFAAVAFVMQSIGAADLEVSIMPDELCSLKVPLTLGFQLGIPARDNSSFYAECFSANALQHEIQKLNERIEIGLLVKQKIDPQSGEITVILNNTSAEQKGLTLRSGHLLKGKIYVARAFGSKIRGKRIINLRLQREGSARPPMVVEEKLSRWSKGSALEWEFIPEEDGVYLCSFLIQPDSEVSIRGFSLLPEDSLSIWRGASINVLQSTGAGFFRWPVVSGMDFYNWYDGVGDLSRRFAVQPEKTGLTHHDFGTAEYVDFCRTVGVEPLICVPLYTSGCTDTRIADLNAAAQLAADWVAYCNADDPHPLALLRKRNGLGDPLRVKHWELVVPEAGALISPLILADNCQRTIQVMKEEDADILVGATLKGIQIKTLDTLLQRAGKQLDFVTCYAPGAYERIKIYNQKNDTHIMFANTLLQGDKNLSAMRIAKELAAARGVPVEYYINWYRSLGIAGSASSRLALCYDGPVCLPYYAEQVLGLNHGLTRLSTDIGLISAMIGRFPAVTSLKVDAASGKDADALSVTAAWTEDGSVLVVFVYNPTPQDQLLKLNLSQLKKPFAFWIMDQLGAELTAAPKNTTLPVSRRQKAGSALKQVVECWIGPASFTRILVKE
ncbi:MAG: hypothetical protein PF904_09410 [Kiritimatiellae bacterium]|jgi:hypothetical protein|nr:hypothetical protein [Kiritimatiellia bacterium]